MKIKLVEAGPKILPVLPDHLIERATASLEARGVEFLTGLPVTGVDGNKISLKDGDQLKLIHSFGQVAFSSSYCW